MKFNFLLFFCILGLVLNAQPNVEFISQKNTNGVIILANNAEFAPVSIEISFILENLNSNKGSRFIIVIPAKANQFQIAELIKEKRK